MSEEATSFLFPSIQELEKKKIIHTVFSFGEKIFVFLHSKAIQKTIVEGWQFNLQYVCTSILNSCIVNFSQTTSVD